MKRLFKKDRRESYTKEASQLDSEATMALCPIIDKYRKMGYSLRDIEYVINSAINCECVSRLIGWVNK